MTSPATTRPRVLYATSSNAPNRLLESLITALHPGDVEYTVLLTDHPGPLSESLAASDINVDHLPGLQQHPLRLVLAVGRALRRVRPDVVHANMFYPSVATEVARALLRSPPPSLLTRHHDKSHHLAKKRVHVAADAFAARHATMVAAVSVSVRDTLTQDEAVPADKVVVVHNGIEIVTSPPDDDPQVQYWRRQLPFHPRLVTVGRLDPSKDLPTLLATLVRVLVEHPNAGLGVAGLGPDDYRQRLLHQADSLGLRERVRFLGWVDPVQPLVATADVYVHSALDEAFGLAVAEAMALGVPIAAVKAGGIGEVIGDTYPLSPAGDSHSLARLVNWVLQAPDNSVRVDRARKRVNQHFSAERMAQDYLHLYRRIAAQAGPNRAPTE